MFDQNLLDSLKSDLDAAKSVVIVLPPEPDQDTTAAGLALYQSLQNTKQAQIGCSRLSDVKDGLAGIEKIQTSIGNKNLVIVFDYPEDKLEKIDYEKTDDGKAKLIIKPRTGETPPTSDKVTFKYTGAEADMVFVLGIKTLEELGRLYSEEKNFFDAAKIVSFNQTSSPSSFAKISLHSEKATCLSEIITIILKSLNIPPTAQASSNMFNCLTQITQNFSSFKVTADTFEATAYLMRNGARREFPATPTSPMLNFPGSLMDLPPLNHKTKGSKIPNDWQKPKVFRSGKPTIPGNV